MSTAQDEQTNVTSGVTWAERLHEPKGGVPYSIALAAAAMVVYPSTPWMQSITG